MSVSLFSLLLVRCVLLNSRKFSAISKYIDGTYLYLPRGDNAKQLISGWIPYHALPSLQAQKPHFVRKYNPSPWDESRDVSARLNNYPLGYTSPTKLKLAHHDCISGVSLPNSIPLVSVIFHF